MAEELFTLGLKLPTDPRWANLAEMQLGDILTDHAYCEQKAASSGISLIQAYPECDYLVDQVSPVVAEEWEHFRLVLEELRKRGLPLGRQRKDEYVLALRKFPKGGNRQAQMLDRLLCFALIEARSCERFKQLSEQLEDEYLREFYRGFMVSEAGHYKMFLRIAKEYCPKEMVLKRWQEWLHYERELMPTLEVRGDRMH